jgi:chromosome segregation ATPase
MSIVARIGRRLGIVRAGLHAATVEQLRKSDARCASLQRDVEQQRALAKSWKEKTDTAARGLKEAQGELKRSQADARRRGEYLDKARTELTKVRLENAQLRSDMLAFHERIVAAERELGLARESLMVVEVKLDILEGAAKVLDRRTRTDWAPESRTGASA